MIGRNVLLTLGILALLAGAGMSVLWLRQQRAPTDAAAQPAQAAVLAATRAIATGSLLRPEDIGWIEIPAAEMTGDDIARGSANEADFVGALTRKDFHANEPLVAGALVKQSDRSFLAAILAPGMRAITIAVDAAQTASGLVLPGDHVDVILTQMLGDHPGDPNNRAVGETVLSDVRVVAIDQSLGHGSAPGASDSKFGPDVHAARSMTLELSERDAEKLMVAAQLGKIDLSVRALETDAATPAAPPLPPIWAEDVSLAVKSLGARSAPPPVMPGGEQKPGDAIPATRTLSSIEVMHGAKIEIRSAP